MKYCPNCGSGVEASDTYCYECGEDLSDRGAGSSETEEAEEAPEDGMNAEEGGEESQVESTEDLTDVEAIGETKAEALRDAGYETIDDLREATQEELANKEGIGKAFAARIKSNVARTEEQKDKEEDEEENEGEEEEKDDSGMSGGMKVGIAFIVLLVVVALALSAAGGGSDVEPDTTSDSPDTQESGTTDGSSDGSEETAGTDSSDTETEGSGDTSQSSSSGDTTTDMSDSGNQDSVLQYGETYTRSDGVEITVEDFETIDSYIANGYAQTPEEGNKFVQVYVTARNTADEEQSLPYRIEFSLIFQNRQYETAPFAAYKDDSYQGTSVRPGIIRDGSIVFETTEEADLSEIQIVWSSLGESATWSEP